MFKAGGNLMNISMRDKESPLLYRARQDRPTISFVTSFLNLDIADQLDLGAQVIVI